MILADTDVLIDYLAGNEPNATRVHQVVEAGNLQTTAVTCFELLSGAGEGKKGDAVRRLIEALDVLPLDRNAAQEGAKLRRELDRMGQAIGMADSLIGGIALSHGLPLLTGNQRHFARVPALVLV